MSASDLTGLRDLLMKRLWSWSEWSTSTSMSISSSSTVCRLGVTMEGACCSF